MAHFTTVLTPSGPIVRLFVSVSEPRYKALQAAGATIPNVKGGDFLVDTGAGSTVVDAQVMKALGLSPTGSIPIHTPSTGQTPQMAFQYDVGLVLPHGGDRKIFASVPVIAADFSQQNIHGLLGRDLLAHCLFIYNGTANSFSLAF